MKKLLRILTATILSVAFMGSVASAQSPDCGVLIINGTGPGSNNVVTCTTTVNVNVVCTNNIYVLTSDSQNAVSGSAVVGGNVTGGTAITGNATNENNQTVQIGADCGESTTPVTPVTPVTPGSGSATPAAQKVAVLPYTATNSTLAIVAGSLAIAASVVIISRLAVAAYRRASLK